jgi:hypothetical protein
MLIHASLPQSFWEKAMIMATEIYNMLPHSGIGKIPYEEFWKLPAPALDRYKVFGCIIEVHIPKEIRPPFSMWDKRANWSIYISTDSRSGYKFWDIQNKCFNHTHNCTFFENEFPTSNDFPTDPTGFERPKHRALRTIPSIITPAETETQTQTRLPESLEDTPIYDSIVVQSGPPPPHESNAAQSRAPVDYKPSFDEAMAGPDASKWQLAMLDELRSIDENKVWKLQPPSYDQKALGCR